MCEVDDFVGVHVTVIDLGKRVKSNGTARYQEHKKILKPIFSFNFLAVIFISVR